jgi:hypothetical protein
MRRALLLCCLAACTVEEKLAPDALPGPGDGGADDGAAPETTITEAPDPLSNQGSPTFEFVADEPASFVCAVDGGPPEPCESPFTIALDDGPHAFSVRAIDGAGNSDPSPAEHAWAIDTVAPDTELTSAPPADDNSVVVIFEFTADEPTTSFDCALDGGAFAPCQSGGTVGPLADGAHSFAVRARDGAGNVDPSPATHAWTVDTSTPDTVITGGPSGSTQETSATFTFEATDGGGGVTFECALDDDDFASCTSPKTFHNLQEREHTFAVRVRDGGDVDPTPATRTWRIDRTAPDTSITGGPSGTVAIASASFTFTATEDGASFDCRLDGAAWQPCTSPTQLTDLAQGPHTFDVRATDAAGMSDATPASRTWTVDSVAPETSIVSGPTGTVTTTSATFDLDADETSVTFECRVDSAPFAACTDPMTVTVTEGPHTFAARATDAAGNLDASPATRSWTVDTSGPTVTITGGPSEGGTSGPYVTFTFTASEGSTTCSLDGAAFAPCTSPVSASLAAGGHSFAVRATDGSGNVGSASRSWTVVCNPPSAAGAFGLFHLDAGAGPVASNSATGGIDAVLGDEQSDEPDDPSWTGGGRFGGALDFVAAEGDHLSWPAGETGVGDLAIELWARPDAVTGDLLASADASVELRVEASSGQVRFAATLDGVTVTSALVAAGAWHHVLVSNDGTDLVLWVDGVRSAAGAGAIDGVDLSSVTIGAGFAGELDEIYLSETAIAGDAEARGRYCPL